MKALGGERDGGRSLDGLSTRGRHLLGDVSLPGARPGDRDDEGDRGRPPELRRRYGGEAECAHTRGPRRKHGERWVGVTVVADRVVAGAVEAVPCAHLVVVNGASRERHHNGCVPQVGRERICVRERDIICGPWCERCSRQRRAVQGKRRLNEGRGNGHTRVLGHVRDRQPTPSAERAYREMEDARVTVLAVEGASQGNRATLAGRYRP